MILRSLVLALGAWLSLAAAAEPAPNECPNTPYSIQDNLIPNPWAAPGRILELRNANQNVPPEIARIGSGAVVTFMGMSVNAGINTWAGYDADRAVFVSISSSSGARAPAIPVARGKLRPNQFIRAISIGQIRRTEVVTVAAASSWQAQEFACLANLLMAAPIENIPRVVDLDGLDQFELRLSGSRVDVGAGIARFRLERAIGSLIRDAVRESEADAR